MWRGLRWRCGPEGMWLAMWLTLQSNEVARSASSHCSAPDGRYLEKVACLLDHFARSTIAHMTSLIVFPVMLLVAPHGL